MRILPALAMAATFVVAAAPAASAATTPTADLSLSRLSISVSGNTVTVTAIAKNLGPDRAQPAVQLDVWGGKVVGTTCTFNQQQFPDSADGNTCEIAPLTLTGTTGMIVKMRVQRPTIVSASATVYDLANTTDPNASNDGKYRQLKVY